MWTAPLGLIEVGQSGGEWNQSYIPFKKKELYQTVMNKPILPMFYLWPNTYLKLIHAWRLLGPSKSVQTYVYGGSCQ